MFEFRNTCDVFDITINMLEGFLTYSILKAVWIVLKICSEIV